MKHPGLAWLQIAALTVASFRGLGEFACLQRGRLMDLLDWRKRHDSRAL